MAQSLNITPSWMMPSVLGNKPYVTINGHTQENPYYAKAAAGDAAAARMMAQKSNTSASYGGGGGGIGGSYGGGGGLGGGVGLGSLSWDKLMQMDTEERNWARTNNQNNWNQGVSRLNSAQQSYANDPMTQGARSIAGEMMANPEAINDQTQQKIINRARTSIDSQANAALAQGRNMLAAQGQLSPGALQALNDRINRQRMAGVVNNGTNLDITRANQRNADYYNAMNAGRTMGNDANTVNMGAAQTYLQNMPQYQPANLGMYAAGLNAAMMAPALASYQVTAPSVGGYSSMQGAAGALNNLGGAYNLIGQGSYGGQQQGRLSPGQVGAQSQYYNTVNPNNYSDYSYGQPYSGPSAATGGTYVQPWTPPAPAYENQYYDIQ